MNVSRFCAPDMRQAIRLVRESLGPDAVILSNRKCEEGIEIIAAIDYDESLYQPPQPLPADEHSAQTEQSNEEIVDDVVSDRVHEYEKEQESYGPQADTEPKIDSYPAASPASVEPAIDEVRREINELRELLETQLAHFAWGEMKQRKPIHAELLCRLERLGLDRNLIERLAETSAQADDVEQAWQLAMTELAGLLPVCEDDLIDEGGVIALVGSTGVGKTTSLAKLAARYVLRYGQRHVALVTTDCYRIGAHDQLMTFGRILGVPVQVAANSEELRSTLLGLSDKRLVLIDTAGMSQRDIRLHDQLGSLIDSGVPTRTLLVLSATSQRSVLEETVSAFSSTTLSGAIVTKVDETASLGGLLSVLIRKHVPLAYLADGQRVPEDLHLARAGNLVQRAAGLSSEQALPEESAMAEQYGEVVVDAVV